MSVRIVAVHAGPGDVLLLEIFLEPLHGLVGIRLDGVLHLDLQHQVAAALEVQPQPDVVLKFCTSSALGLRQADDAEDAHQDRHHNDHGPRRSNSFFMGV